MAMVSHKKTGNTALSFGKRKRVLPARSGLSATASASRTLCKVAQLYKRPRQSSYFFFFAAFFAFFLAAMVSSFVYG